MLSVSLANTGDCLLPRTSFTLSSKLDDQVWLLDVCTPYSIAFRVRVTGAAHIQPGAKQETNLQASSFKLVTVNHKLVHGGMFQYSKYDAGNSNSKIDDKSTQGANSKR